MSLPRPEYPRPQFVRSEWMNLNGEWEFDFDDSRAGERAGWHRGVPLSRRITVPFCPQSKLSAICETGFHDVVWYRKQVYIPAEFRRDKRVLLHFGAVDYEASVWVNGIEAARHNGGHTPFSADITPSLSEQGHAEIVVKAVDHHQDMTLPRGKQYWREASASIFYTRTTGIWQTVWLEAVPDIHVSKVNLTPNIDTNEIGIRVFFAGEPAGRNVLLHTQVSYQGETVAEETRRIEHSEIRCRIGLQDFNDHGEGRWWSPGSPNLYDIRFTLLTEGTETDRVWSYFGMRKISVHDGRICLNNRPYPLKMVLDQGYFPDGILTAPSDADLRQDVELTKAMGFNGVRKHQKIEDPRYLYWADRLGLLVWGEMANACAYSEQYVQRIMSEWQEAVDRDYNHPSIMAWVPINESWGVPNILVDNRQQHHALAMYHLTKSLDDTRLVISNDGWEHVKSDICTIHDYESRREVLSKRYASLEAAVHSRPANRWIHVPGFAYEGEPLVVSEYGGISFKQSSWEGWGYSIATSAEDYLARYRAVTEPMMASPHVQGFCYTQLTDVEQEINGLLTYDRKPKIPLEQIKAINDGKMINS